MPVFYAILCLCVLGASAEETCSEAMSRKKLSCDNSEELKGHKDYGHKSYFGWKSFDQPDADIKWACCTPSDTSPERPNFSRDCVDMLRIDDQKCPDGQRIADYKAFQNRNFTAYSKADQLKKCCISSCYIEMKTRGLSCPVATKTRRTKNDFTNPFGTRGVGTDDSDALWAKSDAEIKSKCCYPTSVCYTKLTAKNLDCNDFGLKAGRNTPHVAFWFRMSRRE